MKKERLDAEGGGVRVASIVVMIRFPRKIIQGSLERLYKERLDA